MSPMVLSITVIIYLGALAYLGFIAYRNTRSTSDYLVAGRKSHPFVMAISYGATFISTSAIVGFGGVAAVFGMGLLWLVFLNIFVGIFIAFLLFGKRTRRMGHHIEAHTFPELLGRRFNSRFLQAGAGLIIVLFMPLYAAAVLIGGARYIESTFTNIDFRVAVAILSILIASYVYFGGLKGVMYTDALQGALMLLGMFILIGYAYLRLGGVVEAHRQLEALPAKIEAHYEALLPEVRAAAPSDVGEEQLLPWLVAAADRLKAAKPEEKAALLAAEPTLAGVEKLLIAQPMVANRVAVAGLEKGGFRGWTRLPATGSRMFYILVTSIIMGVGIGVLAQPQLIVRFMTVNSDRELNRAVLAGGIFILVMPGVAYTVGALSNVWFSLPEHGGRIAIGSVPGGNLDLIIPTFVNQALPQWFGAIFMLTLLSAAMSTLSSQFHTMGTAIGRDFFERGILGATGHRATILITRLGIVLSLVVTVLLSYKLPPGIIAVATAVFFGLCASSFLPAYLGGLYWRRMTRPAAIASVSAGLGLSFFWLMFVQNISGRHPALLAQAWFGKPTLLPDAVFGIQWNCVEALFIALPVSTLVAVAVTLFTRPEPAQHLALCFDGIAPRAAGTATDPSGARRSGAELSAR